MGEKKARMSKQKYLKLKTVIILFIYFKTPQYYKFLILKPRPDDLFIITSIKDPKQ